VVQFALVIPLPPAVLAVDNLALGAKLDSLVLAFVVVIVHLSLPENSKGGVFPRPALRRPKA